MFSKRIFLTGFMGAGKTTNGRKLAAMLQLPFIDLDEHIEAFEKKSIRTIFSDHGESAFREIEQKHLLDILQNRQEFVLALGGGTLEYTGTTELVKKNGLLIYIELPVSAIFSRLQSSASERPLIAGLTAEDLRNFIDEKLRARVLHYRQAHISVNGLNLTAKHLQRRIIEATSQHNP